MTSSLLTESPRGDAAQTVMAGLSTAMTDGRKTDKRGAESGKGDARHGE